MILHVCDFVFQRKPSQRPSEDFVIVLQTEKTNWDALSEIRNKFVQNDIFREQIDESSDLSWVL